MFSITNTYNSTLNIITLYRLSASMLVRINAIIKLTDSLFRLLYIKTTKIVHDIV